MWFCFAEQYVGSTLRSWSQRNSTNYFIKAKLQVVLNFANITWKIDISPKYSVITFSPSSRSKPIFLCGREVLKTTVRNYSEEWLKLSNLKDGIIHTVCYNSSEVICTDLCGKTRQSLTCHSLKILTPSKLFLLKFIYVRSMFDSQTKSPFEFLEWMISLDSFQNIIYTLQRNSRFWTRKQPPS